MLEKDLQILPRQSGKTESLKLKAIELHSQFKKVYFIAFCQNSMKDISRYFNSLNINIECSTVDTFNHRFCKEITEMPAEYRLVYESGIHIIVDEYMLIDTNVFQRLTDNLFHSKYNFYMYGKSSQY